MAAKKKKKKRPPWRPFMWHDMLFAARYGHLDHVPFETFVTSVLYMPIVAVVFLLTTSAVCGVLGAIQVLSTHGELTWWDASRAAFGIEELVVCLTVALLLTLIRFSDKRILRRKPEWQEYKQWSQGRTLAYILLSYTLHALLFAGWLWAVTTH